MASRSTARRLANGGRIDRSRPLTMHFDGRTIEGFRGDTLASALIASGERVIARSFKYHRPRGIVTAGPEEPNALVEVGTGPRREPNVRATTVEAVDGLEAFGQNAWPSVRFDLGTINRALAPVLAAGFYYKTFIGPFAGTRFWMFCEHYIRRAAGMGRAPAEPDPDSYEKINAFADLVIVGSGPSGLSAALLAGRAGADVVLVEQDTDLGGSLLSAPVASPSDNWRAAMADALQALPNVRILTRTTAFGAYDGNVFGLIERVNDTAAPSPPGAPRQRYHLLRARQSILATGAIEQPLVFAGNDHPGVMLASAARTYRNRYAVLPGERIVIATSNDTAYGAAIDLASAGADVTMCDLRLEPPTDVVSAAKEANIRIYPGTGVLEAIGNANVVAARIAAVDHHAHAIGPLRTLACDVVASSSSFAPALHLWSQRFGKPVFDAAAGAFVPFDTSAAGVHCAGRLTAAQKLGERAASGRDAAVAALKSLGVSAPGSDAPEVPADPDTDLSWTRNRHPATAIFDFEGRPVGKAFVDLQHDVTLSDIDLAHREGYVSVEHLKRYTTTGMANDQGKTSNIAALARMAERTGRAIAEAGTTTFRPPYTPIAIGAIAAHSHGPHLRPYRLTPLHAVSVKAGAVMTDAGAWKRAWYVPQDGEDRTAAYKREAAHVRAHVGMVDVSTLGKIAVQGPDAAEFLNRIYVNGWKTLPVGRLRYGIMLREDGFVMDDGATARLAEHDYFMTTTTANAATVMAHAEFMLQTAWTDLRVHVTSISDQWAAIAVAGPKSRDLLSAVVEDADLSPAHLKPNHLVNATIAATPVRIHRLSYSGELAFEIYIPAHFAEGVWQALEAAGDPFSLIAYGTEAMGALRIEKGHVAGPEIDGRTTLRDLGLEGFASSKKPFIGAVLRNRPALLEPDRPTLVGLEIDGELGATAGSLLFAEGAAPEGHGEGWVSSTTYSPALGRNIALAFLARGPARIGEKVQVVNFVGRQFLTATVVSPHFFDPEGKRQNA